MASELISIDVEVPTTAADWLIELYTAESIDHLLPEFVGWLNRRPENRRDFDELEEIYLISGEIGEPALWEEVESLEVSTVEDSTPALKYRQWSPLRIASVTGAVVVLVLGVGAYASGLLAAWGKLSNGQYSAQYGTVRNLDLADDSLITLNGGSQVTLDLQTDHRRVTLDRGEALFRVEKDTSRPFDVKVGSATVRSVGTVFSVRKDTADAAETVVQEGKVLVMGSQNAPYPVDAGQTVRINGGDIQLEPPAESKVDGRLAWTAGLLSFNGERLSEVAKEFNRCNHRKLAVDADVADQPIGGLYPSNNPDGFANAIELTLGIKHSLMRAPDGTETLLLSRKRPASLASQGVDPPNTKTNDTGAENGAVAGNRVEEQN
jgi:transmembrane sensor